MFIVVYSNRKVIYFWNDKNSCSSNGIKVNKAQKDRVINL